MTPEMGPKMIMGTYNDSRDGPPDDHACVPIMTPEMGPQMIAPKVPNSF